MGEEVPNLPDKILATVTYIEDSKEDTTEGEVVEELPGSQGVVVLPLINAEAVFTNKDR